MANIPRNIERGAVVVSDTLIIGGYAEYCLKCGAPLSSDGCSNTLCLDFRGEPFLQVIFRRHASTSFGRVPEQPLL